MYATPMMLAGMPTHQAALCHWSRVRVGHINSAAPSNMSSAANRPMAIPVFLMNIFHKADMVMLDVVC